MTNLVLIALSLTLFAEPPARAPAEAPLETAPKAHEAAPSPPPPEPVRAAPAAVKPSENDIEVLSEVVDLEETQDPAAAWYGKGYPERLRILALPTARTARPGGFELIIDHRASSPIYNKDSPHAFADMGNTFLGFDSALSVGLGVRYGIIDRLDAGLYRTSASQFDTYELDARFGVLRQEGNQFDLMVRAGLSWFVVPNHADALWPFAQVFASRLLFNRLLVTTGAMYHANSSSSNSTASPSYTPKYRNEAHKWSVAGAAGLEYRFVSSVSVDAEVVSCTAGFCTKNPAFSGGVKFFTTRHTFALVCGNTQYLTSDGYITNTDTPWSKLVIGFNITREY
jgi:hypothetical protein